MKDKVTKVFPAAIIGNILEYYDFTVYSVFAIVIGKAFFPRYAEVTQIILSLGVFALGFLTRPIGGLVFGYIGDNFGRRAALICSMLGMTLSTFIIGIIPEHSSIGIWAPIALTCMRLIQGLCISGEGAGAAVFVLEHHGFRPGFTAGLVNASNIVGTIIATSIGIFISKFYPYSTDAWRYAFILGAVFGLIGLILRLNTHETPVFKEIMRRRGAHHDSLEKVYKKSYRALILTFCTGGIASSTVYLLKAFTNIHCVKVLGMHNDVALLYLMYGSIVMMIGMPIFGHIGDIFGKTKVITISAILTFIFITPVFMIMSSHNVIIMTVGITLLGILTAGIAGNAYIFVISLFKPEERFFGVGFGYNFGVAIFGGTAPVISTYLIQITNLGYAPGFYIMGVAFIFILSITLLYTKPRFDMN